MSTLAGGWFGHPLAVIRGAVGWSVPVDDQTANRGGGWLVIRANVLEQIWRLVGLFLLVIRWRLEQEQGRAVGLFLWMTKPPTGGGVGWSSVPTCSSKFGGLVGHPCQRARANWAVGWSVPVGGWSVPVGLFLWMTKPPTGAGVGWSSVPTCSSKLGGWLVCSCGRLVCANVLERLVCGGLAVLVAGGGINPRQTARRAADPAAVWRLVSSLTMEHQVALGRNGKNGSIGKSATYTFLTYLDGQGTLD